MGAAILLHACEYFYFEKMYADPLVISVTISNYFGGIFYVYKIKNGVQVSEGLQWKTIIFFKNEIWKIYLS